MLVALGKVPGGGGGVLDEVEVDVLGLELAVTVTVGPETVLVVVGPGAVEVTVWVSVLPGKVVVEPGCCGTVIVQPKPKVTVPWSSVLCGVGCPHAAVGELDEESSATATPAPVPPNSRARAATAMICGRL